MACGVLFQAEKAAQNIKEKGGQAWHEKGEAIELMPGEAGAAAEASVAGSS